MNLVRRVKAVGTRHEWGLAENIARTRRLFKLDAVALNDLKDLPRLVGRQAVGRCGHNVAQEIFDSVEFSRSE